MTYLGALGLKSLILFLRRRGDQGIVITLADTSERCLDLPASEVDLLLVKLTTIAPRLLVTYQADLGRQVRRSSQI